MALALATMLGLVIYSICSSTTYNILVTTDIKVRSEDYKNFVVPITSALLNLLFIFILNVIYEKVANCLTEFEFHRTQTEYDNSLMLKTYMFQFVNYYSSLFYIAFIKGKFTGHPNEYHRIYGMRQEEVEYYFQIIRRRAQLTVSFISNCCVSSRSIFNVI